MKILLCLLLACTQNHFKRSTKSPEHMPKDWYRLASAFNENENFDKAPIISFLEKQDLSKKIMHTYKERNATINWPIALFLSLKMSKSRDEIVEWLIERREIDFDEQIDQGYLINYIIRECSYKTFEKFMNQAKPKLDVSTANMTPVILAIYCGDMEKLRLLLRYGAKVNDIDIAYACWHGKLEALKLLKPNFNKKFHNLWLISYAALNGSEEIVEYALAQGSPYYSKTDIRTTLAQKVALSAVSFGVQTFVGLTSNSLGMQLLSQFASIFLNMVEEVMSDILSVSASLETVTFVNQFTSCIFKSGKWALKIDETDKDRVSKLKFAIKKVIEKNKKDKSVKLDDLKKLHSDLSNKDVSDEKWANYIMRYKKLIAIVSPQIIMRDLTTLKRNKIDLEIHHIVDKYKEGKGTKTKVYYTLTDIGKRTLSEITSLSVDYKAIDFYLPTKLDIYKLVALKHLKDGEYLLLEKDVYDMVVAVVKDDQVIETKTIDYMSKETVNFFFLETVK